MDVPIRVIGIATTFFWVFLVIFGVTALYSAKDLNFSFGNWEASLTPMGQLVYSQPIAVMNKGFYDIGLFNVSTTVSDADGSIIANAFSSVPVIAIGNQTMIRHDIKISLSSFLGNNAKFLFEDSQLDVEEIVGLQIAEMIPVQANGNFSIPWGAPLYDLGAGSPTFEVYNMTHRRVIMPLSFENHAIFDIVGDLRMRLFADGANGPTLIGEARSTVNVPKHFPYIGNLEIFTPASSVDLAIPSTTGHYELYFATPLFDCGPVIMPYER